MENYPVASMYQQTQLLRNRRLRWHGIPQQLDKMVIDPKAVSNTAYLGLLWLNNRRKEGLYLRPVREKNNHCRWRIRQCKLTWAFCVWQTS